MANRMINCAACNRSVRNVTLHVVGGKAYCRRCLNHIWIKGKKLPGRLYIQTQGRIFVEYWIKGDRVIAEFDADELVIGKGEREQEEKYA